MAGQSVAFPGSSGIAGQIKNNNNKNCVYILGLLWMDWNSDWTWDYRILS
jgi:hypothetical protein